MTIQVKIHTIETISEARPFDGVGLLGSAPETEREASFGMVVQSELHGDMQRSAEMPDPIS
jgi:hypothetical protein